jgi:hypothetical protein
MQGLHIKYKYSQLRLVLFCAVLCAAIFQICLQAVVCGKNEPICASTTTTTTEDQLSTFSVVGQRKTSIQDERKAPLTFAVGQERGNKKKVEESSQPPKLLLGIFTSYRHPNFGRLRRLIRHTYLDFYRFTGTSPNRVCSLQEFSKKQKTIQNNNLPKDEEECQIVYTFVFETNQTSNPHGTNRINPERSYEREQDAIYLSTQDDNHPSALGLAWYKYVASSVWRDQFDYIAYCESQVLLLPTHVWKDDFFSRKKTGSIYGGYATREDYYGRYVVLSRDLVEHVVSRIDQPLSRLSDERNGRDKSIAALLKTYPKPIARIKLDGIIRQRWAKHMELDYLETWDKYKDSLLRYDDPAEIELIMKSQQGKVGNYSSTARLLLGITTMDTRLEADRRALIRKTYLKYFEGSRTPHRICSLLDLLNGSLSINDSVQCQMAYTFVVGANPSGPKELVEVNTSYPITTAKGDLDNGLEAENDVVYLNIQENGKEGKSQTWFKYATTVLDQQYFDYIGKTDTDTIIYPGLFLENTIDKLKTFPNNIRVYGGDPFVKESPIDELVVGPAYMQGRLYWISPDLARYITSSKCNRSTLAVYSEDKSVGNFVNSHTLPIQRVRIHKDSLQFEHPVKDLADYRRKWERFLQSNHQEGGIQGGNDETKVMVSVKKKEIKDKRPKRFKQFGRRPLT